MYIKTDLRLLSASEVLYLAPVEEHYIIESLSLSPAIKITYSYIASQFEYCKRTEDKDCTLPNIALAAATGLSEKGVGRIIKQLQVIGLVRYKSTVQADSGAVRYSPRQITAVIDVFNSEAHRVVQNKNKKQQYKALEGSQKDSRGKAKGLYTYDKKASEDAGYWIKRKV